ncbi:ATP-binding protein [Amycolatopsis mongoliensis]|uniref:ATP-binding protein n=1 Tax=Amycolatopsis mongoliensis TaxID=715475 RepID=A0A9Y2JKA3_9PSEU|nr:ATP-binding protein [Amycolatopsis sp. 4-36]WIX98868.1 ATP-binding protein [Amycolatopsis sp. 4-36]
MPEGREAGDGPVPWSLDLRGTTVPALVEVRRWAARTLGRIADDQLGDVLLVATELVTNAYDHGRGPLRVRMSHTPVPCRVRIEVDDSCPDHPVITTPAPDTPGGRGMQIVDKLATAWGVLDHATGGKTVWAEIVCDRAGTPPCAAASPATGE